MFRKKYTPPCFEKNYDCFRAEGPDLLEQTYKEMMDDIKHQTEHMEERIQEANKAIKAMIESKEEQIKILKEGTVEQKVEILAEKYACELEKEIQRISDRFCVL